MPARKPKPVKLWHAPAWWENDDADKDDRKIAVPEQPSIVTDLHKRDRAFSRLAGVPRAWRKLTPLQAVFARGQLANGSSEHTPQQRFDAGQRYTEIFDISQSSGRDSLDPNRVAGSGKSAGVLSKAQTDAIEDLISVEMAMSERDRKIVRLVCGEGHWPSEAVKAICGEDYAKASPARFREALDALIEAFRAPKKQRRSQAY